MWWRSGALLLLLTAATADDETAATERARTALAARLQVPVETLEVLDVEPAEWPSSALGCPREGDVYQQVITSGHRVRLGHGDESEWVHVAGRKVAFCEAPGVPPRQGSLLRTMTRMSRDARRDLARRLGLGEEDVTVERVRPLEEEDTLGECPPLRALDPPLEQNDVLELILEARGVTHRYLSDGDRLVECGAP